MHKPGKSSRPVKPFPKNPLLKKLRERKIFETIAGFVGGGWLILEFVHWILIDHYKWPERLLDLTFVTLVGALLITLTSRWFKRPDARRRKIKPEYLLIPLFALLTLIVDLRIILRFDEHEGSGGHSSLRTVASDEVPAAQNSIAVLPFRSLNAEAEEGRLHEGMTDALIGKLSTLEDFHVISSTSVLRYAGGDQDVREIGRDLNVASVLEGSVQKQGDDLRISVRLNRASDGVIIWSETYGYKVENLFVLQDRIAQSVIDSLHVVVKPDQAARMKEHGTEDLAAYNLYLEGKSLWNKRTRQALDQAVKVFKQAIEKDPSFAAAYSGIADTYIALANISALPPTQAYPEAREWARRALQMDNNLAEAHASIAVIKLFYDWDWEGVGKKFQKALELNPSYAFAYQTQAIYLTAIGREKEARSSLASAMSLDPTSPVVRAVSGLIDYMARNYRGAAQKLDSLIEKHPDFPLGEFYRGLVDIQNKDFGGAAKRFSRALSLAGGDPRMRSWLGFALYKSGEKARGQAIHQEMEELARERYVDPFFIALLHLGAGETDQAFEWLEKAYAERSYWMIWFNIDPILDEIRRDPRFLDILARLNFTIET